MHHHPVPLGPVAFFIPLTLATPTEGPHAGAQRVRPSQATEPGLTAIRLPRPS